MKKNIIILFLIVAATALNLNAQFVSVNQVVIPVVDVNDQVLLTQLDSILLKYSISKPQKGYLYYMYIEEIAQKEYAINIVYAKPSFIEKDLNTGYFEMADKKVFIIREESEDHLFLFTKEKKAFKYEKKLIPTGNNNEFLIELVNTEEFYNWKFSYMDSKLNLLYFGF